MVYNTISSSEETYHSVLTSNLLNIQVYFKPRSGQTINLKVKPKETIKKMMQLVLEKGRAKPNNVRLDILTSDNYDGAIGKYLLKYISVDKT